MTASATLAAQPMAPAAVLAAAADVLESHMHARMGRVDLHLALHEAAPTYELAQAGMDLLVDHLRATGADDRWVVRWTARCGRDEIAAHLRAAAEAVVA
ncbi:hypothetical protein [Streptosporangium sp. CA-115845]|uniref:hypothetical protein n=1 Tax=Streptosporangium sp. CA-115845 TaxID=3240071 RepID=UPI003D906169